MANTTRQVDVCSQCKTAINDELFLCVCCGVTMHLSKKCTGFADDTIKGIIQEGLIILSVCNQCAFTNQRDALISKMPSQAQDGKIKKVVEEANNFKSAVMEKLDLIDHDGKLTDVKEIRKSSLTFEPCGLDARNPLHPNNLALTMNLYKKGLKQTSFMMVSD